MGRGANNRFP